MVIDFSTLADQQAYFTITQLVVPRPIAWVLSSNPKGTFNLAPFSFFNAVGGEPPYIAIGIGRRPDGTPKDTHRNIQERPDFVVHLPSVANGQAMVQSSATLPPETSEVEAGGIALEAVEGWPLPRIRDARVALLCRREKIVPLANSTTQLILAEVTHAWIDPTAASTENGRLTIDPTKLDPLSRLGGNLYSRMGPLESYQRP